MNGSTQSIEREKPMEEFQEKQKPKDLGIGIVVLDGLGGHPVDDSLKDSEGKPFVMGESILGDKKGEPSKADGEEKKVEDKTKPSYDLNDVDNIGPEASKIPEELKTNQRKLFALTRKLDVVQKALTEINNRIYRDVSEEKGESIIKFSDTNSVNKETSKRLEENKFFINKKSKTYLEVCKESVEGKPKFTSEKAKEAETKRILLSDHDIIKLEFDIKDLVKSETVSGKIKYTNDKSRDYEVNKRVCNLEEYKLFKEEEVMTIQKQQECHEEISYLNKRWDYLKMIISLMQVKYRVF